MIYKFNDYIAYDIKLDIDDISPSYYELTNNKIKFICVGMFVLKNHDVILVFPKEYPIPDNDDDALEQMKIILQCIKKYNTTEAKTVKQDLKAFHQKNSKDTNTSIIGSMTDIIEYFYDNNGINKFNKVRKQNASANIDWAYTLKKTTPDYVNGAGFVYLYPSSRKKVKDINNPISNLFWITLDKVSQSIGFLYDINFDNVLQERNILFLRKDFEVRKNYYKHMLQKEIYNTFNENMLQCLNNIYSILFEGTSSSIQTVSFVTKDFESIWETIISFVFMHEDNITLPPLEITYFKTKKVNPHQQYIDTIYKSDDKWVILDSKYYNISKSEPGKGDFLKQFFYEFTFENHSNVKFNALLFNYTNTDKIFEEIAKAKFNVISTSPLYGKFIYLIGVNQLNVYKAYATNSNNSSGDNIYQKQLDSLVSYLK